MSMGSTFPEAFPNETYESYLPWIRESLSILETGQRLIFRHHRKLHRRLFLLFSSKEPVSSRTTCLTSASGYKITWSQPAFNAFSFLSKLEVLPITKAPANLHSLDNNCPVPPAAAYVNRLNVY